MCGRFILRSDLSTIKETFDVEDISTSVPQREDFVPGQDLAAVIQDGGRRLVRLHWGLIPFWAKDRSIARRLFNARAETVAEKPSFRDAFKKRRCLIPVDGFYEWQKTDKGKIPFLFCLKSGRPFGLAGLFEMWVSPANETVHSCAIITTEANRLIEPIHDRMPVIIPKDKEDNWLDPTCREQSWLRSMLTSYPADEMNKMDVSVPK
ncbi:MAG: SOS response-associated peptidase [Deltaproteobacteria bacterium]|nr:SOS response-associated peptidase [Deltaproteobacteria bacterium]